MEFLHNLDVSLTSDTMFRIVRSAIILLFGIPITFLLSRWLKKLLGKKFTAQQSMLLQKVVTYSASFIMLIMILNEFQFKLSTLLGAAGIIGIALGFASQTSVSNVISGLFLIAEKSFQVNDIITVGNTTGVVLSIDVLSVKLRTFDNRYIRIPNETLIKTEVINVTRFPIRRVDVNIGVAYKEDVTKVRQVLMDIAKKNPLCLDDPEPLIIFSGFGNSSIDFLFLVWAVKDDWLKLKNTIMEDVKKRFDQEGIEIPFPHLSLYSGSVTQPIPIQIVKEDKNETSLDVEN